MTNFPKPHHILMCKPTHYDVTYTINPWMKPGTVNRRKALRQWMDLVDTYKNLSISVDVIDQESHSPDMVFATDCGIFHNGTLLVSNFNYPERQREGEVYAHWFGDKGYKTTFISSSYVFEGGDCLLWRNTLFFGTGFRTGSSAARKISQKLNIEVIPLVLCNPDFYHLDTCLFFLNNQTAFYYPPAFDANSRTKLQKLIPTLIPFTQEEAFTFSANSVVAGKNVLVSATATNFMKRLMKLNYTPIPIDVSEFIKSGGGIHCLTHIIN